MRTLLPLMFGVLLSTNALATQQEATVKVNWQNPEKYSDIRPSSGSKKAYQKRVISAFDKIWADFAKKLPVGHSLVVTVKDLDLAGDVNPMYRIDHSDIRVIKEIYFPRMTFDYQLLDSAGQVVAAEQDVKVKDMGFMHSSPIGLGSSEFVYEKQMLKHWFQKTLTPKFSKP
jgi:hypothetical protein